MRYSLGLVGNRTLALLTASCLVTAALSAAYTAADTSYDRIHCYITAFHSLVRISRIGTGARVRERFQVVKPLTGLTISDEIIRPAERSDGQVIAVRALYIIGRCQETCSIYLLVPLGVRT